MSYFIKLFFFLAVPMGFGVGLLTTFRWGLSVGIACVIGVMAFSGITVLLVKSLHERQVRLIEAKQFNPNVRFARRVLFVVALLVLVAVPLLFIYTPLRHGIASGDLPLVIGALEMIFLYVFFRSFRNIRKIASTDLTQTDLREPVPLPSLSFFIVAFVASCIGVMTSLYNRQVALVFIVGCLIGYWIYRDFFAKKEHGVR